MARRPFKVVIPDQPDLLTTLSRDILTKHTAADARQDSCAFCFRNPWAEIRTPSLLQLNGS